jgi:Domain of unknown function (DUF4440)
VARRDVYGRLMTARSNGSQEVMAVERERLRALVDVDMPVAELLHADDFQLVNPHGGVLSKDEYLGGIASGEIHYHRFEPTSDIDTLVSSDIVVIRYQSAIDGEFLGQPESVRCWHTDCYRRNVEGWQIVWSQATAIDDS